MFNRIVRTFATNAEKTSSSSKVFNVATPPKYTLGSLRSFPSLEPHTYIPLPASFCNASLRRDILWSAVVYEADGDRVGSGNVITKSDQLFSHKKLRPQKGSGRARVGDANSPSRYNLIKAHGITAPHDWSTELPNKIYARAIRTAFSEKYREGRVFIIGGDESTLPNKYDTTITDFKYSHPETTKRFVKTHDLSKLNLLFVTDVQRDNLIDSTEYIGKKASVLIKEVVQVRDILKANRIYIEAPALQWLIGKYGSE